MAKTAFQEFASKLTDDFTSIASKGESSGEFSGFVNTDCYLFNALLSGSLFGGLPNNKIIALCGEEATGKSFLVLGIAKSFLQTHPEAAVVYYDTEAAINNEMMASRGIDTERVLVSNPDTIQTFQNHALKTLEMYHDKKFPLMIVLDSLGNLSTTKEMADSLSGKDVADMTRAKAIRAAFRTLTLKCAKYQVPLVITNHVYINPMSMYPVKEVSGGGGIKYAASIIVMLSKSKDKDKDTKEINGVFIKAKLYKSRLTKENSEASMKLSYTNGLDRYYGLLELGEEGGLIKREGNQYLFPNGDKAFKKVINAEPERFWTPEMLKLLEDAAKKAYMYGGADEIDDDNDGEDWNGNGN